MIAVATLGRDPQAAAAAELMRLGKMPSVQKLKKSEFVDLCTLL